MYRGLTPGLERSSGIYRLPMLCWPEKSLVKLKNPWVQPQLLEGKLIALAPSGISRGVADTPSSKNSASVDNEDHTP